MQRNCRLCVYLAATRNVFAKEQNTTEENTNAQTEEFFFSCFSQFFLFLVCTECQMKKRTICLMHFLANCKCFGSGVYCKMFILTTMFGQCYETVVESSIFRYWAIKTKKQGVIALTIVIGIFLHPYNVFLCPSDCQSRCETGSQHGEAGKRSNEEGGEAKGKEY